MEERVDNLLKQKRELAGEILGGGEEVSLVTLSDSALLELVSLDIDRAVMQT
jgi:non-specific serine/threonine protein kinase